jgi:hypothetical protein
VRRLYFVAVLSLAAVGSVGAFAALSACSETLAPGTPVAEAGLYADVTLTAQPWLSNDGVFIDGHAEANDLSLDCRTVICQHNENTDLIAYAGSIFLVHRTALSQTLGPDSALHVYESTDDGATFLETATIQAPTDRDIRDPAFFIVNGELHLKALARLPSIDIDSSTQQRDTGVDTITMGMSSNDGATWSAMTPLAPDGWSFWRVKQDPATGIFYSAAYQDGDLSVSLFSSTDGVTWTQGAQVYGVSADTPLETELTFMASANAMPDAAVAPAPLLALVRMDGTDADLSGDTGPLRTKVCWANAPYATFDCPTELDGVRLDGPVSFFWNQRLFVVARKHLQNTGGKKRTALYEITGALDAGAGVTADAGGAITIKEWGEIPSAGDTSYAGVVPLDATRVLVSWYSGDLIADQLWPYPAIFSLSDIWKGTIDLSKLQ